MSRSDPIVNNRIVPENPDPDYQSHGLAGAEMSGNPGFHA